MSLYDLLWFLLIGLVAGWLAGLVMKGSGFGVIGDIIIGVIGALVGGVLFRMLGFETIGTIGALITAFVGAVVLLYAIRFFKTRV